MKRLAKHTVVRLFALGNADKMVITELWKGITTEEYGCVTKEKM
jgi:hypothetical protein